MRQQLLGNVAINATGSGDGDITIKQIGQTDLTSGVTGTVSIGNTSTNLVDFDGRYFSMNGVLTVKSASGEKIKFTGTGATTVKTADDAITFDTGDIQAAQNLTINSTGGAITIGNVYSNGGTRTLTINADAEAGGGDDTSETVTIGSIGVDDEIGAVLIDAQDGITLTGNIALADAAGADLNLDGPVLISGDVTIDNDNTNEDGLIDFESTIDGVSGDSKDDDLVIKAGDHDGDTSPGGVLTFGGSIGDTTPLTTLKINATAGTAVLDIPQIGGDGVAGVTGQVDIGNSNTARIDINSSTIDFGTGDVTLTAGAGGTVFTTATPTIDMVQTVTGGDGAADGGNLTITGAVTINNGTLDINSGGGNISITGNIGSAGVDEAIILDDGTTVTAGSGTASTGTITLGGTVTSGDITLIGDSGISIAGDITSNKTASAGAISFTGPVTLAGNVVITSDDHATSSITFNSTATINSDSTARTLKLDTDGGAIVLNGAVGAATNGALSSLTINGPDDGKGAGDIDVANIGGSAVGVTGATVIGNTNTDDLVLDGTVYNTTGAQTYTAATGDKILVGTTNNAVSFNTSNANVAFNTSDVKLASGANLTVDTDSGNNGTITFQGSIHGTGNTANTVTDITSLDGGGAAVTVNAIDSNIEDISITGPTTLKEI